LISKKLLSDDIVSYTDSNVVRVRAYGQKSTHRHLDNYYINIPTIYITPIKNPLHILLYFKKKVTPTYEDMREISVAEIEKSTFY
jgi:hypothetical protein